MQSLATAVWAGETLTAFPEKALFWKKQETLILADPHFGKDATFRAAGIPVPDGGASADLQRLDVLLDGTGARRLLILGDFFHAAAGRAEGGSVIRTLTAWRATRPGLRITLIRGNHDLHAGDPPPEWNFEIVPDSLAIPPFLFRHDPRPGEPLDCADGAADLHVMCGHIHPAVRLRDTSGATVRLPCFHFGRDSALLPAFGSFTGTAVIRPRPGDQVFVIADGEIVEVPTKRAA